MRVLVYMPYAHTPPHLETDLELIGKHLAQGDDVWAIQCDGVLAYCDGNPYYSSTICAYCKNRSRTGLDVVGLPPERRRALRIDRLVVPHGPLRTVKDLMELEFEGFPIGQAVASSLISRFREPDPDMAHHARRIETLLSVTAGVYRAALATLRELAPDRVYLFNGRFAYLHAWLHATQELGIEVFVHERSTANDRYTLTYGTRPHALEETKKMIVDAWEQGDPARREQLAAGWYERRRKGAQMGWYSFVRKQTRGVLPQGWQPNRRNVAIFNSSEDEFAAVLEYQNKMYRDQQEALERILSADLDPDIHFTLRVHPCMAGVWNSQSVKLEKLACSRLTLIPPDSPVDTYALLEASEKAITFGSTVGIEANFWGKPSILLGRSAYEGLGGCEEPRSHEETIRLINARLEPRQRTASLIYGHFFVTNGVPFELYVPQTLFSGRFQGKKIRGSSLTYALAMAVRVRDRGIALGREVRDRVKQSMRS